MKLSLFGSLFGESQSRVFVWSKMGVSERKKTQQSRRCEKVAPILRRFSEQSRQNAFFVLFGDRLRTGLRTGLSK